MTQEEKILEHLQRGSTITPLAALDLYGCFRLGAVIFRLRKRGFEIETQIAPEKNYARYTLVNREGCRSFVRGSDE